MAKTTILGRIGKPRPGRRGKIPSAIGEKLSKILERYGKLDDITSADKQVKYPVRGYALILNFIDTDLKHICEETETVTKAFRTISCPTRTLYMDLEDFEEKLLNFFDSFNHLPRFIYISCHGEELTEPGELTLCGGCNNTRAKMPWSTIHDIIAAAECDVLVIMSCCSADTADIIPENQYAKELITIPSCNETSYGTYTGTAVQKAVEQWYSGTEPSDWTGWKFYTALRNIIRETRASKIHKHLTALVNYERKVNDAKSELETLGKYTDPNDSQKKSKKEREDHLDLWEKVVKCERDMLEQTKRNYTQPHYSEGQDMKEDTKKDDTKEGEKEKEGDKKQEKKGDTAVDRNTWRLWNPPRKEKK